MLDLIIIGAGPAGITAAVYAARKRIEFAVITKDIGGQTSWSGNVENYTGYQFITGPDLAAKFEEHMRQYKIQVMENEEVTEIVKTGKTVKIRTSKGLYEARSAVVASGKVSKELGVPGEKEFKNRGLTYCATCDGPIFAGKDVAVIGGGNSALDAALQLVRIAKRVYVVNVTSKLGGDPIMRDKVESNAIVKVINDARVTKVTGDSLVTGVEIETRGKKDTIHAQGVFVEIGLVPNSAFAIDVAKNGSGEIIVDRVNQTNVPGIFAAGDVTDIAEKQIVIAAGEGSKAALSAFRYLNRS
jgi:alkyl hydroperoxide reductase subunit AhpF